MEGRFGILLVIALPSYLKAQVIEIFWLVDERNEKRRRSDVRAADSPLALSHSHSPGLASSYTE